MLPHRRGVALHHRDHQGVRQQPHDAGALDPAHLPDPSAQVLQIQVQDRRIPPQSGGAQDIGGGLGRRAFDMDGVQPEAQVGQAQGRAVFGPRHQPLQPLAGDQGRDQPEGDKAGRDRQRPAGAQSDPLRGADLGGRVGPGARARAWTRSVRRLGGGP